MMEVLPNLRLVAVSVLTTVVIVNTAVADELKNLQLTLPEHTYAVVGTEVSIYFDNIVLTETPENYRFAVQCEIGHHQQRRWTVTPNPVDIGIYDLTVSASHVSGSILKKTTRLHVVPAESGANRSIKLMIVGDSLTHATLYPNELASLLSRPGNPVWKMLGTHRPKNAATGVRHEGYGGWTWQRFVTKYEANPDGTHRKRSSPFVFLDAADKPQLNMTRYFQEATSGERPDVAFFLLGINDCFSANPDDLAAIDARIDAMLIHADRLLGAFRAAAPQTDLAICITTPPNARESGFEANYHGKYHRWGWKRIQHQLVQRLQKHFAERSDPAAAGGQIYVVPTHLNLDPIDGYPDNNGVHPNAEGYRQIGTSLYCWLKWWLWKA